MKKQVRLPAWAVVGLASGALLAAVMWLAGLSLFTHQDEPALGEVDLGPRDLSPVLYGKYRRLAICIQVIEGSSAKAVYVQRRLRDALAAFHEGPPFPLVNSGPRRSPPNVALPAILDIGCPRLPAYMHGEEIRGIRVASHPGTSLPDPSPYHLHMFVRVPLLLGAAHGGFRHAWFSTSSEEHATDNPRSDVFGRITSGLQVTVDDFADLGDLERFLASEWRLEPIAPLPTPTGQTAIPAKRDPS